MDWQVPAVAVDDDDNAEVYTPVHHRQTYVPAPARQPEMSSMAGAVPLAALTATPGTHLVELHATYDDRAAGFVRSTLPMWWAISGASAAIVLVVWVIGPLSNMWAFALGWWATSELLVLALTSVGVWAAMWWRWHRDGPDAIASRSADARLRMAEKWFSAELKRTYGGNDE
jgi:hypothetical protein